MNHNNEPAHTRSWRGMCSCQIVILSMKLSPMGIVTSLSITCLHASTRCSRMPGPIILSFCTSNSLMKTPAFPRHAAKTRSSRRCTPTRITQGVPRISQSDLSARKSWTRSSSGGRAMTELRCQHSREARSSQCSRRTSLRSAAPTSSVSRKRNNAFSRRMFAWPNSTIRTPTSAAMVVLRSTTQVQKSLPSLRAGRSCPTS